MEQHDTGLTFGHLDLEGFKRGVLEFVQTAPTLDREALDNGWKAVGLMYLGFERNAPSDQVLAESNLMFAQRRYMDRDFQLFKEGR